MTYDDDEDDEEDFGETELDRNAGDYGPSYGLADVEDADAEGESRTVPVASPSVSSPIEPVAPRATAKTAPLLPAQRPPEIDPDDVPPTMLDREPLDPARPPPRAAPRDGARTPARLPAPPLPMPGSDLGLKLLLAGLVLLIVVLLGALAVGVMMSAGVEDRDDTFDEGVRR